MTFSAAAPPAPRVWGVGALCQAAGDLLQARFNPVTVLGELSGVTRAASGHVYFSLKDAQGQLRCAMFRRAASLTDFVPRDGLQVEARGRLGIYEARGDLQLVVESLSRAGQGALFEQFLQLKARLQAQGLFDPLRKRPDTRAPRAIGLVTSLGAAALHDVLAALGRRAPHVPVLLAPAPVQGADAPQALVAALASLYALCRDPAPDTLVPDTILLVRGGGSLEDLWAFNDEALAHAIVRSPVPLIAGVGHDTDVTIADFCADLRAPTPTAAAELAAAPLDDWLGLGEDLARRLTLAMQRRLDSHELRLDQVQARLGRPSGHTAAARLHLVRQELALGTSLAQALAQRRQACERLSARLVHAAQRARQEQQRRVDQAATRLGLLDPRLVLQRGYAWLSDAQGHAVTRAAGLQPGQALRAVLADGAVDVTVNPP